MTNPGARYLEDHRAGEIIELGSVVVERDEVIAFASAWDPMPFHLDEAAAKRSIYGGLTASGWHTALIMMRLMHGKFFDPETSLGSPGLQLHWDHPVRPGDRLTGGIEIHEVRASRSRPEMGFVRNTASLTNQDGIVVYRSENTAIVRTRAAPKEKLL